MTILITSNEPKGIKNLFSDKIEVPMRFDIKLYTESGTVGIERKTPTDFISSVEDGRLRKEILAMREECKFQVVLLHGVPKYSKNGLFLLSQARESYWTKNGISNLLRTIQWVEQCYMEYASDNQELVDVVEDLEQYLNKGRHLSLKGRPSIHPEWIRPTEFEQVQHFYDGIPGIAPVRAKELAKVFPNPMDLYKASVSDISTINGFGKPTAQKIFNFLRGVK